MIVQVFRGEYRFLSNLYGCPVEFEGLTYRSSEAAYQASKCTDTDDRVRFTRLSPSEAKRLGGSVMLRGDWEDVKVDVMHRVLRSKFSTEPMRKMLLNTGDVILEESNYWGDRFWGTYKGEGENYLGILLMIVRGEIQEGDI